MELPMRPAGAATRVRRPAAPQSLPVPANRCSTDRYETADLAEKIHRFFPKYDALSIEKTLRKNVDLASRDKVPREQQKNFPPEMSISAFEASEYLRRLIVRGELKKDTLAGAVGRSLQGLFFGGDLSGTPAPLKVKAVDCHDGDTCKIIEQFQPDDGRPYPCNTAPSVVSVRISGIDAPEIGYYNEEVADGRRLDVIEGARKQGKQLDYPYGRVQSGVIANSGWINPKLVENVDKVHMELARGKWDPKTLPYAERSYINSIIASIINFTGELSKLIRKDLLTWEKSAAETGSSFLMESQIRWISDDTPAALCNTWQPYDIFARRLGSFLQPDSSRLTRFIRTRLPLLMRQQGPGLYAKLSSDVATPLRALLNSKAPGIEKLKEIARTAVDMAPEPARIYSEDQCGQMAAKFEAIGRYFNLLGLNDDQAMQVITGSVYSYEKYRNPQGAVYRAMGEAASEAYFGLWNDKTFRALWAVNSQIPRYNPPNCKK